MSVQDLQYIILSINLGLVTPSIIKRVRKRRRRNNKISEVMLPREKLIVGGEEVDLPEAYKILEKGKKGLYKFHKIVKSQFINFRNIIDC